jgi:predicted secreted protein
MNRIGTAILLALVLVATAPVARAGDGAAVNVLGFSADGRYFAFEQYGKDGSGTPYSSVSAVEIAGDRPVKGTPVSAIMEADNPGPSNESPGKEPHDKQLADIRARAAADAAALLQQLGIASAGQMVAAVRDSHARRLLPPDEVKNAMKAAVGTVTLPADRFGSDTRLVLREFDIALPRCNGVVSGEHPTGLALTVERKGRPTIHLRRDQTIPPSRRCPERYGIAEAHALHLADGATALAVVIQYFYPASEGPDRRFLVVTGRIR